jgi:hypothetical protein
MLNISFYDGGQLSGECATRMDEQDDKIEIDDNDRKRAYSVNRGILLDKLRKLSPANFHEFVKLHAQDLLPLYKRYAPALFDKKAEVLSLAELQKIQLAALQKITPAIVERIDMRTVGLERVEVEKFARERIAKLQKRKDELKRARDSAVLATTQIGKGLKNSASAPVLMTAGLFKSGWNFYTAAVNILSAGLDLFGVSRVTRVAALGVTTAAIPVQLSAPVDATPYFARMYDVKGAFHQACTPELLRGSAANVSYTMRFNTAHAHSPQKHAHDTMMMASKHGVPAIALHLISYLETGKFTDMKANNSTASGPFQIIKSTKILYLIQHGKETSLYKDAQQRMASSTASAQDLAVVRAVDAVSALPLEHLNKMVKAQKYPGYVHDALAITDLSAMAAELVAIDIAKKYPEIKNNGLSPEGIVRVMSRYYSGDHFLGRGNYDMLQTISLKNPSLSITDEKAMTAAYGAGTAKNMKNIVSLNPGLLKPGMTAGQALTTIDEKFRAFVREPLREFAQGYDPSKSTYELCLSDKGKSLKQQFPQSIPLYQSIMFDLRLDTPTSYAAVFNQAQKGPAASVPIPPKPGGFQLKI